MNIKNAEKWEDIEGSDLETSDYPKLTKIKAGYSTKVHEAKSHDYPEEIFIV